MSLISVLQSLNDVQFLNATCVNAAYCCFLWGRGGGGRRRGGGGAGGGEGRGGLLPAAAIVLVTAISPVTKMYASD